MRSHSEFEGERSPSDSLRPFRANLLVGSTSHNNGRWWTEVSNQFRKLGRPMWSRVRLLHLPPLPDGVNGSTPGSEPGSRGSSPRLAAHVIVVQMRSTPARQAGSGSSNLPGHTHTPVTQKADVLVSETSAPQGMWVRVPPGVPLVADAKDRDTSKVKGRNARGSTPHT